MEKKDLPKRTAYIVLEYYKNNIQPFLSSFAEDCLWIGPAQGQMIRTKKALNQAFSKENHHLTFSVENLHVIPLDAGIDSLNVVLLYTIHTFYPNGDILTFQQRVECLWIKENFIDESGNQKKDYFIRLCHISNEFPYDSRDSIYPNHFHELDIAKTYTRVTSNVNKLILKGPYNSYFYLTESTLLWVESIGTHTLFHAIDKTYESIESLTNILKKYPNSFIRIHASYAINPIYVSSIHRFYVEMKDGTKLNIPEKKYTKTRDEINRQINNIK